MTRIEQGFGRLRYATRNTPWRGVIAVGLLALALGGCTALRAQRNAEDAVAHGDYDSAVAYYRKAWAAAPERVELRIALERVTRVAASEHVKRARDLESQDQLTGAMAEYRLAADLDPTNTLALTKAVEIERRLRDLAETSRPQARIENLRAQAAQASPIPRLDPRVRVPQLRSTASVRDLLKTISDLTGINVNYDRDLLTNPLLSQSYPVDLQDTSLEDVLTQILQANQLTFKVQSPRAIFVYQDTPQKRAQYEEQYYRTFYLSNSTPADIISVLQAMIGTGAAVPPRFIPNPSSNTVGVRATAPVLQLAEQIIRSQDRPKPEVMIEAEILEVDTAFIRRLGLDLSQYALGFTFSPELAPPNTASTGEFPFTPPPFNLNTISQGVSAADFYMTSPTSLIRLLESNTKTRVLARPQMQGRDGVAMTLSLGDSIPIPTTTFQSAAAGGIANVPTTSVNYQSVGVNLLFTPRVTYSDEVVLENFRLEKSGLGNNIDVAGQSFPTISQRTAQGAIRLRDGESTLIAGLRREDERNTQKALPGFSRLPIIRNLLGNSDAQTETTDLVMIVTPHILRSHELTTEDLKPLFIGTNQNIGASAVPQLISLDAIGVTQAGGEAAPAAAANAAAAGAVTLPSQGGAVTSNVGTPASATPTPRAVGIVPIEAVPAAASSPAASARITVTPPTPGPDGSLTAGAGPFTMPITIANAPQIVSISLSVTYDPAIIKVQSATPGSFMNQGGVAPTFVPRIDAAAGRVDLVWSRPASQAGAGNSGLLGALAFTTAAAGTANVTVSGVATGVNGQSIALDFSPARIVVK